MVTMATLSFMRTQIKVFNPLQHVQNFTILQCTPLPLLKKKTSSPWPLKVIPLALLPQDLASASPQYPGLSELSIPTSPAPLEVVPPSFPLEINMLFYHKLLLAELPMLLRSPNTSIQLSPTQSPQKHSFKAVVKKKKPFLITRHRQLRLAFALKHREWTVEDWKRVIWSDETKINRIGSDGKQWVWKQAGDGLIEREVQGTVKFGGGNIMVWGCMGWNGVGKLAKIEGRMDAKQYVEILDDHLLPSIEESGIAEGDCIFQQDNDPKHTSRKAINWMEENDITLLDWEPQSPDLNPIVHLWHHIKLQLCKYEAPVTGVWQIWERVAEVWNAIEPEVCQKLIESMPRRVEAVIKAKGGNTKY